MEPIVLRGRLASADVWFSEPGVGTLIFASGILVPDELETRGVYAVAIYTFAGGERCEFAGDVTVEPAQTNAVGQRRERTLAFATKVVLSPKDLDGSEITLTIEPTKKSASDSIARFRAAMGTKAKG